MYYGIKMLINAESFSCIIDKNEPFKKKFNNIDKQNMCSAKYFSI